MVILASVVGRRLVVFVGRSKNTRLMGVALFFCSLRASFFVGAKISV